MATALQVLREDDFVEYFIFPRLNAADAADETRLQTALNDVLKRANAIVEAHSKNYLWHKDAFVLAPITSARDVLLNETREFRGNVPPHLYGVTHYGDNIEDEWFLVFLLMQITKEIEGAVARVIDADGEFLLIEAADYLPQWADPDVCDKRVYLYNGALHLVPLKDTAPAAGAGDGDTEFALTMAEAVEAVRTSPGETLASSDVQNCICKRTSGYPESISSGLQHARVFLPVGVAGILRQKPGLISAAVRAFCDRDAVDMRACRAMKFFPPEARVFATVAMTKHLYAMLVNSKYMPERKIGWNLPAFNSPDYKACNLGVRIACGFEILITQAKPSSEGEDVEGDRAWERYVKNLQEKGYFKGLLEGSKEHTDLTNKAKSYYREFRDSMHHAPSVGQEILQLSRSLDSSCIEQLRQEEANLPEDDDDSWLACSAEELDDMLEERYGRPRAADGNLTKKLDEFLHHVSEVDGAEFPPARKQENNAEAKIDFDPNSFSCAIKNMLDLVIPNDNWDLESGSEMSDFDDEADSRLGSGATDLPAGKIDEKMKEYMEQMDRELAASTIGQSFEQKPPQQQQPEGDAFDDVESFKAVDIDMNALKNILESYQSQMGAAGPATNMLGPMGVHLESEAEKLKRNK